MLLKKSSLTPEAYNILFNKATEIPNTGKHTNNTQIGTYLCRLCGLALFRSDDKFTSSCGWPSFDAEIDQHIKKALDRDQRRTEILCSRCDGHLGHIFHGENYTHKNTRYCVNSLSLDFIANNTSVQDTQEAIIAAGCFWGVEYIFKNTAGVLLTDVGYTGDPRYSHPDYNLICSGKTQHVEALRVIYEPSMISYEKIIKLFFEIHDFTQTNGQGPDIGRQYLSKIFYYNTQQYNTAQQVINLLKSKNYKVATDLQSVQVFWPAEDYHQDYYFKNKKQPYCHQRRVIF
ncbi:MAG: bifunctional methionine sulfoxide reductase B/A protein [Gammaproteobacteria bacterium]|nr:bifunctional methionine sulfoxide reductase B/A protein [Gammaproteobacteria bacterium]